MWVVSGNIVTLPTGGDGIPFAIANATANKGIPLHTTGQGEVIVLPDPDEIVDIIEITPSSGSGLATTTTIAGTTFPMGEYTLIVRGGSNLQLVIVNNTTFDISGAWTSVEVVAASGTVTPLTGVTSPIRITGHAWVSPPATMAVTTVPVAAPPLNVVANGTQMSAISGTRPRPGQYVYNPRSNTITLLRLPATPSVVVSYVPILQGNLLVDPSLLPPWVGTLNVEGEIVINREFEGHPSGQFVFRIQYRYFEEVLDLLKPKTELSILNIPLRIERLNVVEEKATTSAVRECIVSVELGGYWANYTGAVRLNPFTVIRSTAKPQSPQAISVQPTGTTTRVQPMTRTIQQLAASAGAVLDAPTMKIDIEAEQDSNAEVDWASLLNERVRNYRRFTFWSDPNAIRAVEFGAVPHHFLDEGSILSPIQTSYPVTKAPPKPLGSVPDRSIQIVPGVLPPAPLSPSPLELKQEPDIGFPEWYTGQLCKLGKTEADDQQRRDEPQVFDYPSWERLPPASLVVECGDSTPPLRESPPRDRDPSLNFDQSGPTKTVVKQWIQGGAVMRERVQIFGYAFLSKPGEGGWQQVEERDRRVFYEDGYYVGSVTTGWRLMRYRTEESFKETVDLTGQDLEPYQFFKVPIADGENIVLHQYGDYYPMDVTGLYEVVIDPDGKPIVFFNPNWYEPMFVRQRRTGTFAHAVKPGEGDEPPLKAGLETITREDNIPVPLVYAPWAAAASSYTPQQLAAMQQNEVYMTYTHSYSAQDSGYANCAEQSQGGIVKGRPPEGQRMPAAYIEIRRQGTTGGGVNSTTRSQNNISILANTTNGADAAWYIYSANYKGASRGTISFSGVETFTELRNAAESTLYASALRSGQSDSFETFFSPNLKEGDLLTYVANGVIRRRRIMGVSHRLKVLGAVNGRPYIEGRTELTLARDYDVPAVTFVRKSEIRQSQAPQSQAPQQSRQIVPVIRPPYYVGRELSGGIPTKPPGDSRYR